MINNPPEALQHRIKDKFPQFDLQDTVAFGELTIEVHGSNLHMLCYALRDDPVFDFNCLMDLCGVDYLEYGISEWETTRATVSGFERAVDKSHQQRVVEWEKPRFAVVYHLLSTQHNHRIRLRTFLEKNLLTDSVIDIWPCANWFEREAFDLYGILFKGHPDLRRILTDYGFIGHPFRKDFPLIGEVEARYDAAAQSVVYEPVSIESRVLVPKVIRLDNRYLSSDNLDSL
jgi:NADH-quinone oxidoreductase subunit C